MTLVNVNELDLNEFTAKEDVKQHCRATFPLVGIHGSKQLAAVYFELEPGDNLGKHTDSAEELLVVLSGEAEATVGTEKQKAGKGALVLVPAMAPHDIRNIGNGTVKVLGVFGGANNIVATFEKEWMPGASNIIDTALLFQEA